MSMWRAVATVIGPTTSRPDADQLPYGTMWLDPTTGELFATDQVNWYPAGVDGGGQVGPWTLGELPADLTDEPLLINTVPEISLCGDQGITCMAVRLTEPRTVGSATFTLIRNGVPMPLVAVIDAENPLCVTGHTEEPIFIAECFSIGVQVTTTSDREPTAAQPAVMLQTTTRGLPSGVETFVNHGLLLGHSVSGLLPVEASISHGLVLGHQVVGGESGGIPAAPFARYRASELVLSDTDPVATWADEGSGGNDLAQGTGTAQPTYEAAGFNCHPSVLFDGTSDWMQTAVYGATVPQPTTVVIMGEYVTISPTAAECVFDGASGSRNALFHNGATSGDPWLMNAGSNQQVGGSPLSPDLTGVDICMVVIFDGASSEFHVNDGADLMSNNPGTSDRARFTLGAFFNGSTFANIRVVEALIYDRALDASEITALQSYFETTYADVCGVTADVQHGLVLGHQAQGQIVEGTAVEIEHGLVLGHQVQVDIQTPVDAAVEHGLVLGHEVVGDIDEGLTVTTSSDNSGANVTSYDAALPDNLQVGDIVIVSAVKDGGNAIVWPTSPEPEWDTLGTDGVSTGSAVYTACRWRRIDGTEGWGGAGNSITLSGGSGEGFAHAWALIRGADLTADPEAAGGVTDTSVSPNPPSLTPSWSGEDTVFIVTYGWDGNVSNDAYPANYDDNQTTSRWANVGGSGIAMATRNLVASGAEDPGTGTLSASENWRAYTIAVRSA